MAPLSEVFGRRPIYFLSMFFYFIFTLPSALARNAATLVVGRMIAGLAASAPMCNIGGSIADVWAIEERGAPMALFSCTLL
jgi:MFS family permease